MVTCHHRGTCRYKIKQGDILVSTIICPRCKTKNSKKAEICYKCNAPLKVKKPSILSSNSKSKIDVKLIGIGAVIFILVAIIFRDIAYDYSYMISGFSTMVYLYFAFKNTQISKADNTLRGVGLKLVVNYLIIVLIGGMVLWAVGYV